MSARSEKLTIRVSKQELEILNTLAQLEKLPTGTFVRRQMLLEAERSGVELRHVEKNNLAGVRQDMASEIASCYLANHPKE